MASPVHKLQPVRVSVSVCVCVACVFRACGAAAACALLIRRTIYGWGEWRDRGDRPVGSPISQTCGFVNLWCKRAVGAKCPPNTVCMSELGYLPGAPELHKGQLFSTGGRAPPDCRKLVR